MYLLGRSNRERKQNAGNICLLVFIIFMFSTFMIPVTAQNAYAADDNFVNLTEQKITWLNSDMVRIQMLLTPTTDEHFDFIFVDFEKTFQDETAVKQVYFDPDKYGYYVDFVYMLSDDQRQVGGGSWVYILDENKTQVDSFWIDLKIRPPRK